MDRTFTQKIIGDPSGEIEECFNVVGIVIRAKINNLCNENKYKEAEELEKALCIINNTDYNKR